MDDVMVAMTFVEYVTYSFDIDITSKFISFRISQVVLILRGLQILQLQIFD